MNFLKIVFIFTLLLTITLPTSNAWAVFWGNTTFDNLEKTLGGYTGGESFPGGIVNYFFGIVTRYALAASLIRAGFFLALFLALVKFGFGDTGSIKEFGAYAFVLLLLVLPAFGGKPLPIFAADMSDRLTEKIIGAMGAPEPKSAGSAAWAQFAFQQARIQTAKAYNAELAIFRKECYNRAVQKYKEDGGKDTPPPSSDKLDYKSIVLTPERTTDAGESTISVPSRNDCEQVKNSLLLKLDDEFQNTIDSYAKAVPNKSPEVEQQFANFKKVKGSELLDYGVPIAQEESDKNKHPKWDWRGLFAIGKIAIFATGETFLWIFDYYMFDIVAVVKTIAAVGMALGVLYYAFLKDISIPLGSLGIWVFGNGLYIISGIALRIYYQMVKVDASDFSGVGWLLGFDTIFGKAMVLMTFIGVTAFPLAGYLSWKAIGGGLSMFGNAFPYLTRGPKGRKSSGGAGEKSGSSVASTTTGTGAPSTTSTTVRRT